jgi:hypothetical protein
MSKTKKLLLCAAILLASAAGVATPTLSRRVPLRAGVQLLRVHQGSRGREVKRAAPISLTLIFAAAVAVGLAPRGNRVPVAARFAAFDAVPAITVGTTDLATAKANRQAIEATTGTLDLPAGIIDVDQAPNFPSGLTVNGHASGTTITNTHYRASFPLNTSGMVYGDGIEYRNAWTKTGANEITSVNVPQYVVGNVVYLWHRTPGSGPTYCWRSTITAITGNAATLADNIPTPAEAFTDLKLCHGYPTSDYKAGQGYITTTHAGEFADAAGLFFTSGPSQANECYGRFIDVARIDGDRVYLKAPLSEDYTQAALVVVQPRTGVVINGVTFGPPLHEDSISFFSKWTRDCVYNNVGAPQQYMNITTSQGATVANLAGRILFNSSCACTLTGGCYNAAFEEGCYDNTIKDATIYDPAGGVHGIYANRLAPCGRFRIVNVQIANAGRTNGSPLMGFFHDSLIRDVQIYGTQTAVGSYTGGNRLRVENLRSDARLIFQGAGVSLSNVKAPLVYLGWQTDATVSGTALQCETTKLQSGTWMTLLCKP